MFIQVDRATKRYKSGDVETIGIQQATLELAKGDIGVILGPSGSGKSTLLNMIGGIDRVDSGKIIINGINICAMHEKELTEYRRKQVGFIFQAYHLISHLTVQENIEMISQISENPLPMDHVLSAVGLTDKANRFPRELSGGEQQRVAIARSVIKNPQVLLCDEITGALDYASSIQVLEMIQEINRTYGTTVLLITHNQAIAAMANNVYQFRSGEVTEVRTNSQPVDARGIVW